MKQLVEHIMACINQEYALEKSEQEIIQFGIEAALEVGANVFISILILYKMDMMLEGLIFFSTFIPIRTLAGGYHSESYLCCLLFSACTLMGVMILSSHINISKELIMILILILELVIGMIGPIINSDRPVSQKEYIVFSKKLYKIFVIDAVLCVCIGATGYDELLNIVFLSLCFIVATLVIGKIKYKEYQIKF